MMFELKDINVIRIGLQPTENISSESGEVVGGPFHPSFRQLVESKVYGLILNEFFDNNKTSGRDIEIKIDKREVSNLVGQGKVNIKDIRDKYDLRKVKINGSNIDKESFFIIDENKEYEINRDKYIRQILV